MLVTPGSGRVQFSAGSLIHVATTLVPSSHMCAHFKIMSQLRVKDPELRYVELLKICIRCNWYNTKFCNAKYKLFTFRL